MQLKDLVRIVVHAYAILCIALGAICLLFFLAVLVAEDLLKGFESFLPELAYQLVIWGVWQLSLGIFLLLISGVLTRFIVRWLSRAPGNG
jgi:hypothetical protein